MPLSALGLVLLAAVLHASWNIVAKKAGGDHRFTLITSLLTSVVWLPMGLWFGWVEQETNSISSGVSALFVMCLGGALTLGVAVRAVVLWQHWTGGRAALATGFGAVLLVAGVAWFFLAS